MKLEHFGMAEPGDCRLVFTASAEELAAAGSFDCPEHQMFKNADHRHAGCGYGPGQGP